MGIPEWRAVPILPSRDTELTERFYTTLGFEVTNATPGRRPYLIALQDGAELHFYDASDSVPQGDPPGRCYVVVPDIDELFLEWEPLVGRFDPPASIARPQVQPYGMREMVMVDPNSAVLRFVTARHS